MNVALISLLLLAAQDGAVELSRKAQDLAVARRFDEAETLWREAIALEPDYFPALFNLGYMKTVQGKYAESIPLFDRADKSHPGDFNTCYLLGQAYSKLGRTDDALRSWRAALSTRPDNVRLMQVMIAEYQKGRYFQDAVALARRALSLKQDDEKIYLLAINACQSARDLTTGLEIARMAVQRFPLSARANFEYAFHLQLTGNTAESRAFLEKAMAADPTYEEPFFFLGDLLVSEGQDKRAIPLLRKAIENRTDYLDARVSLARALMHLDRWQEAADELKEAARIQPNHPEPHLLLSRLYFRNGDEQAAAREKEIAIRLRRENPNLLEAPQSTPFPDDRSGAQKLPASTIRH